MELTTQHGSLEELLAPLRRESWSTYPSGFNDYFHMNTEWSFDSNSETNPLHVSSSNPHLCGLSTQKEPTFECCPSLTFPYAEIESSYYTNNNDSNCLQDYPSIAEDEEFGCFLGSQESKNNSCTVEMEQQGIAFTSHNVAFNMGLCGEKRSIKSNKTQKKIEGQPSKNLMAERRRRKRLNDRLSMLRSIVPKISKMDRTAILGDTIDYMNELLQRINKLQEDETEDSPNHLSLLGVNKDLHSSEVMVRNSPKFDVERRDMDTRIDISCAAKPELLFSTVSTIEALGLEIRQCVISCFNDFSLQASCLEDAEKRTIRDSENIKQALFRNAGYGGRCL